MQKSQKGIKSNLSKIFFSPNRHKPISEKLYDLNQKKTEELGIIAAAKEGDKQAKEQLLMKYDRLVKKIVNYFIKRNPNLLSHEEDLIQEGKIGVLEAIMLYDEEKSSFSHYVTYHIYKNVMVFLSSLSPFSMNCQTNRKLCKIKELMESQESLEMDYDQKIHELSSILGISEELTRNLASITSIEFLHLDQNLKGNEDRSLFGDFIPSDEEVENTVLNGITHIEIIKRLNTVIVEKEAKMKEPNKTFRSKLTNNDSLLLLLLHTGFLNLVSEDVLIYTAHVLGITKEKLKGYVELAEKEKHTYDELGKLFGISRQRIAQLINRIAKSVRSDPFLQDLLLK